MSWADTNRRLSEHIARRHAHSQVGRAWAGQEKDLAIAPNPSIGAQRALWTPQIPVTLHCPVDSC